MKVYLDDIRPCPKGWILTKTAQETIDLLEAGGVTSLSLDHDLGDEKEVGTGYDVLRWIETQVIYDNDNFKLPRSIKIHTANPPARERMQSCLDSIKRMLE